jgi:hypothetical protein
LRRVVRCRRPGKTARVKTQFRRPFSNTGFQPRLVKAFRARLATPMAAPPRSDKVWSAPLAPPNHYD